MSTDTWTPFDLPEDAFDDSTAVNGHRVVNLTWRRGRADSGGRDQAAAWLRAALVGLGVLAAAAAAVSFAAQYHLVNVAKGLPWAAALEAAIPDAGSAVFACLGIALALKGKRALRARGGNLACVGLSLTMNLLAAAAGWRGIAIWVMPSAVYAFASDTLIGVIRAYVLARLGKADDGRTMLDVFGGLLLWCLRFGFAPRSTANGFRRWVVEACPTAPGRHAEVTAPIVAALPAADPTPDGAAIPAAGPEPEAQVSDPRPEQAAPRGGSKRAHLIEAYEALQGIDARYGDRSQVSPVARELAPGAGLAWSSARTSLYRHLDGKASS